MIKIRLSHSPPIEVSGLPKDLRNVQQSIVNLIQNKNQQFCVIEAKMLDPYPYDVCLSSLYIYKSESFIRVWVSENSLHIEGESENLEILATWFEFDDDTKYGYHHHFGYFGNQSWVDANSSSLIICCG
ncbi:MAG: hypothetical protein F6K56_31435 [Moorea sp. SIO3G5]|nr:hypothetical protein [Moorena sp. SIO3G5]